MDSYLKLNRNDPLLSYVAFFPIPLFHFFPTFAFLPSLPCLPLSPSPFIPSYSLPFLFLPSLPCLPLPPTILPPIFTSRRSLWAGAAKRFQLLFEQNILHLVYITRAICCCMYVVQQDSASAPKSLGRTDSTTTHRPISVVLQVQTEIDGKQPQTSVKRSTK